jgi:hypothetical protein
VPSGALTLRNLMRAAGQTEPREACRSVRDRHSLPDLLAELAKCERRGNFHDACGVYYVALKPAD